MSRAAKGFTLLELIVAMVASSLLLVGLGSALFVTLQATESDIGGHEEKFQSGQILSDMAGELRCAQSFSTRTDKAVEFTLSDRTGDGNDDTIRWAWTGVAGTPLTRKLNSGTAVTMLEDVQALSLSYAIKTMTETTQGSGSVTTGPYMMSDFEGWTGITPTKSNYALGATAWLAQYFKVQGIPADASAVSITSVALRLRKKNGGSVQVAIHKAQGSGNVEPQPSAIAAATAVDATTLPTAYDWIPVSISGAMVNSYHDEFVIVVKGSITGAAEQEAYFSTSAPTDLTAMVFTSTSGSTWNPTASTRNRYDAPFRAWGTYTAVTNTNQEVTRYFVISGNVALQAGSGTANCIETAIDIVNRPEVSQP